MFDFFDAVKGCEKTMMIWSAEGDSDEGAKVANVGECVVCI